MFLIRLYKRVTFWEIDLMSGDNLYGSQSSTFFSAEMIKTKKIALLHF